jgi:hypothetical protein
LALGDGHCEPASLTYSSGEYASTVSLRSLNPSVLFSFNKPFIDAIRFVQVAQSNNASPPTNWPGGTVPPGVSTSGAAQTTKGTTPQATSSPAAGQTGTGTGSSPSPSSTSTTKGTTPQATSSPAAGQTGTGTGSSPSPSSTSTTKSSVAAPVGHNFPLALGGMIFAGTLLVAVL